MDMRLPIVLHPDLLPVAEAVADQEGVSLITLAVQAVERDLADDSVVTSAPDEEWSRWAEEAAAEAERKVSTGVHSLSHELSARVIRRARRDKVHYLRVQDRAVRRYIDQLTGMFLEQAYQKHSNQSGVPSGYTRYRLIPQGPGTAVVDVEFQVFGHDACGSLVVDMSQHDRCCPAVLAEKLAVHKHEPESAQKRWLREQREARRERGSEDVD